MVDDTAAIRSALAALSPGDTLVFPAGMTFRHTAVLSVNTARVRITGGGVLVATNEQYSGFWVNADNVQVDNLTFRMASTTKRWVAYEQMKVRIEGHTGVTLRGITVDGSAAAGIFVGNQASHFTIDSVTVRNTRADGIHMTDGSHDGVVSHVVVKNPGDDGVAVVSYQHDGVQCYNIAIDSPQLLGQTWGRAFSVVGGHDITWTNIYADGSSSAGLYIAAEPSYTTYAPYNVTVTGGTLLNSNSNTNVDHGGVLVWSGEAGLTISNISISGLTVTDTRTTASRNIGLSVESGASVSKISFANLTVKNGPSTTFWANAPSNSYNLTGSTKNGSAIPDHVGY